MPTNAEMLEQARAAYHKLLLGEKRVSIRYADRSVQFNQTNKDDLRRYIAELEELEGIAPAAKRGAPFEINF